MRDPSRAEPIRATLAALVCTSLTMALAHLATGFVDGALRAGSPLDRPIAALVVGLGTAAAGILATGCWLLVAANLGRGVAGAASWCDRLGSRLTPALLRRAVGLTVGAGLGVAALGGVASGAERDLGWEVTSATASDPGTESAPPEAGPLEAAPPQPAPPESALPSPDPSAEGAPEPTSTPDGPETPLPGGSTGVRLASPTPEPPPEAPEAVVGTVTVRRGDSLWRIAAAHLPGASDSEIAAAWPLWYEANRAVIGDDPNLIHPGQVLRAPSGSAWQTLP